MTRKYDSWQRLFLFCLGIFIAAAFCMKWMEGDLIANGKKFTVIGLEISYPKEEIVNIFSIMDAPVKATLRYHLSFDFIFMPGVYLGIIALAMMGRYKTGSAFIKKLLLGLGITQLIAWGCDITENIFLLKWINHPQIGNEFLAYHYIVIAKWIIAVTGIVVSIPLVIRPSRVKKNHVNPENQGQSC